MYGFHGRLLHIDLTTQSYTWQDIAASRLTAVLGGVGLGAALLYDYAPARVEPLSAENPLIFTSAPLVGTGLTTTAKYAVVTKSPLTGFIADSLSSSFFALELKRVGVDALVITGAAEQPTYLQITDAGVEFRAAAHLMGLSAQDTAERVRYTVRTEEEAEVRVAAIGRAGENLVRFATLSNEGRHAGRGGVGAVFGAKKLKAVALRGQRRVAVADTEAVEKIAVTLRERSVGPHTAKYREIGTVANLAVFDRLGSLPTYNFQNVPFAQAEALSGESFITNGFSQTHGCAACTIRCERLFQSLSGEAQRLEYETLFALGPMCGIEEPDAVLQAARLCDQYGLDTISTGGTIAWAAECADKGLWPELRATGLSFGNAEAILALIADIAHRRGAGALLAEGSRQAATHLGVEAEGFAMQVKGMELPGYEPRSLKTMALGLAVSPRGACHNRSGAYEADFSGHVDRLQADAGRGALVAASEDFSAVLDSLIVCKFLRKCFDDFYAEAAQLMSAVTGWEYTAADLRQVGERINTLKKLFNLREGWQPEDDWLPPRLLEEPLSSGVVQGVSLTPDELRLMIQSYYAARGWNEQGLVGEEKKRAVGL